MCGICGQLNTNNKSVSRELLEQMTAALSHRGPDDSGIFLSPAGTSSSINIGLGHRRLSIIDLSQSGHQPMSNEHKSIWMVFNGEIYNHLSLRKELESAGHRFSSNTDSEVIIHLYEQEGIDCLKRLNGMFAFALWDSTAETFYLCRDHVGIKPVVYCWNNNTLTFASEIRSLLKNTDISRDINYEALNLYLTFNYIPAPHTIYNHIHKLPPGSYLMLKGSQPVIKRYWALPSVLPDISFQEAKSHLYTQLENSVRQQLMADVPVGAFLSGGIDSSIIVGLMARVSSVKVKTFSIGFDDIPLFDETSYAKKVAQFHPTDHTEIKLNSRHLLNVFSDLLSWFDEPFADSSAIATFIVSRETRRHLKVALSGDGGDELFAGYRMYCGENYYKKYQRIPAWLRKNMIEPLMRSIPDSRDHKLFEQFRRYKKFVLGASDQFEERFFLWNQIFPQPLRQDLLKNKTINFHHGQNILKDLLAQPSEDPINRMLHADFLHSLPNDMLTKVDSMSMRNGLEVRVPLLDKNVVELAFQMPGSFKLFENKGKHILRETFKDILPPELLSRPKWGFEIPISRWLKSDLKFLIEEHLSEKKIKAEGIFDYAPVRKLIHDFESGRSDSSWQLWNLIVFEAWLARQ
ncbi:MAG: asparagine synthase (glutamine-hydrolyzing) [Candidatus Omnitrophica bacterium]|nr:asparagine synthase (glutamine-hydrolyzing) [Candidatus Omnitrophota bacterium]